MKVADPILSAKETVERLLAGIDQRAAEAETFRAELAEAVRVEFPAQEDVTAAAQRLDEAMAASDQGVHVRQAQERLREVREYGTRHKEEQQQAQRLRAAAAGVDQVLSEMVGAATSRLRVEAGRLLMDTGRGPTKFADLSTGERWTEALEIAAAALPRHGLLVAPQEAWEALDPVNRGIVANRVRHLGLVLLTAEATDGDLRAEVYDA